MSFSSSHGHDLHLDVKTYRKEKDLPGADLDPRFRWSLAILPGL